MDALETIIAKMDDYALEHNNRYPKRVTVSTEVARELDAIMAARIANVHSSPTFDHPPAMCRNGGVLLIRGVSIVADLDDDDTVDFRALKWIQMDRQNQTRDENGPTEPDAR